MTDLTASKMESERFCSRDAIALETKTQGVFLVSAKTVFVSVERDNSVNTYSRIQLSHEGVSEVSERARERSIVKRA